MIIYFLFYIKKIQLKIHKDIIAEEAFSDILIQSSLLSYGDALYPICENWEQNFTHSKKPHIKTTRDQLVLALVFSTEETVVTAYQVMVLEMLSNIVNNKKSSSIVTKGPLKGTICYGINNDENWVMGRGIDLQSNSIGVNPVYDFDTKFAYPYQEEVAWSYHMKHRDIAKQALSSLNT